MSSRPASTLPACCGIVVSRKTGSRKHLYLRAGRPAIKDYTIFDELGVREALTSGMHTRFYLVPSKEHGDELMHIKSTYNNKYLVAKLHKRRKAFSCAVGDNEERILMDTADEPVEDLDAPSCTLFKLQRCESGSIRFMHHSWDQVCSFLSSPWRYSPDGIYEDVDLIDVTEQIILPPYVTFKGAKGLYLRVSDREGQLEFASIDKADKSATFSPINYGDGQVCLQSELNGKFLGASAVWICADADDTQKDEPASSFRLLKYGEFFVLKSMSNGGFCEQTEKRNIVGLCVGSANITNDTKLWLEEPVISREIYNIVYHRNEHARIYDTADMNMASASAINMTSEKNTVKSSLSITTTESSKHESTSTHKFNVSVSLSAGFSLFKVVEAGVSVQGGYEYSKANTWGESSESQKEQKIEYELSVPANKRVTLTVTSKQAKCDVPFSYTQKDKLVNGEIRIYNYEDGLYTGVNCFDLRYETKEEAIELKKQVIELKDEEDEKERERTRNKRVRGQGIWD